MLTQAGSQPPVTSLMWPPGTRPTPVPGVLWENDLGIGDLIHTLSSDRRYIPYVRQTLTALVSDPAVITWRQTVLADFLRHPDLVRDVRAMLPRVADLKLGHPMLGNRKRNILM